jgi:hypothetical protein
MSATAERMTTANPFRREPASGNRAARTDCVNRVLRASRCETAARSRAEQKNLRGRNRPAINADCSDQNMPKQIHLILQKLRAVQCRQKILFHVRELFPGDGIARDQNQFDGLREFMLMLPETFAQQTPRAAAFRRAADFFARDHAEFWCRAVGQSVPVGDEAAEHEPLALLPDAREIAALREARGAGEPQAIRRFGGHAREIRPASGVCGRCGGGWQAWPCRSCSNCG